MDRGRGFGTSLSGSSPVPGDQAIEIVAEGSVRAEGFLIKQAFDAAAQANLIGVILESDRPTHLTVPATAEEHNSSRSQPGSNHAQRPQPTRLLFLFTHPPQPVSPSND